MENAEFRVKQMRTKNYMVKNNIGKTKWKEIIFDSGVNFSFQYK